MKKHKTFLYKKLFMLLLCLVLATQQVVVNAALVYADDLTYDSANSEELPNSDKSQSDGHGVNNAEQVENDDDDQNAEDTGGKPVENDDDDQNAEENDGKPVENDDDDQNAEENDGKPVENDGNDSESGTDGDAAENSIIKPEDTVQPALPMVLTGKTVIDEILDTYDKNKEKIDKIMPPTSPGEIIGESIDRTFRTPGKKLDEVEEAWLDVGKTIAVEIADSSTPSPSGIVNPFDAISKTRIMIKNVMDASNDFKKGNVVGGVTRSIDNVATAAQFIPYTPVQIGASVVKGVTSVTRAIYTTVTTKGCLKGDVLITMGDGSVKAVKDIRSGDTVLTWNFYKGEAEPQPVVFNDIITEKKYKVAYITFDDGTTVGVVGEHGFFDLDKGEYVYFTTSASKYLGHAFAKMNDDGSWKAVKLTNVEIKDEIIEIYSPVSAKNFCIYANGMLSMPGDVYGFFNYFDVNPYEMKYDEEKMASDLEKYGAYSYDDFSEILSEEMYDAFDLKNMKVSVGKGLISWSDIEKKIEKYNAYLK